MSSSYLALVSIYFSLLLATFIVGCVLVRKSWPLEFKLLIILVGLTIGWEAYVEYLVLHKLNHAWVHNIFVPIETAFILYVLYRGTMKPKIKRINLILLFLLPVGLAVMYATYANFMAFDGTVTILYCFLEVAAGGLFLIDSFLYKEWAFPMRRPLFGLAAGMIAYSSILMILHTISALLSKLGLSLMWLYALTANFFMYGGFIASFVLMRREQRVTRGLMPAPTV